jgi:peroxiredoxin
VLNTSAAAQSGAHERELVKRLKDRPFALISVSADDSVETLQKFLKAREMPWVHWFNGDLPTDLTEDWEVEGFPTIYVIDHKGVIRFKGVRGKEMDEAVDQLLKEMEDDKKNQK